jgi:hypothetical protein
MLLNIVKQTPYIYYNFFILGSFTYLIPAYPGWVIENRKVNCKREL